MVAAKFKISFLFEVKDRFFYFAGEILEGKVMIGNRLNLSMFGINTNPEIKSVEFIDRDISGKFSSYLALGVLELEAEQKPYLLSCHKNEIIVDILQDR